MEMLWIPTALGLEMFIQIHFIFYLFFQIGMWNIPTTLLSHLPFIRVKAGQRHWYLISDFGMACTPVVPGTN